MKADDELIFLWSEITAFKIRSEVINPSEPATLAAAIQTGGFRKRSPGAFAMSVDVGDETLVFFFGPSAFVGVILFATGGSHHGIMDQRMDGRGRKGKERRLMVGN